MTPTSHHPRFVAHHQAPMADSGKLTHLIIPASAAADPGQDRLWADVELVRARGVPVLVTVGGRAPGTEYELGGDAFDAHYPAFRELLRAHDLQGVDLDVAQDTKLADVARLIDALRADFGPDLAIVLAPVASAMEGGNDPSGFDCEQLYRLRGEAVDWVRVQFRSGHGSLADTRDVQRIIDRGVYPVDKLVLGVSGQSDAAGDLPIGRLCATLAELVARHPRIGGVAAPQEWIDRLHDAITAGADPVNALGLIPGPSRVVRSDGTLALPDVVGVSGSEAAIDAASVALDGGAGVRLVTVEDGLLRLVDDDTVAAGGYRLRVDADGIELRSPDLDGVRAGVRTLRQLLPAWCAGPAPLPGAGRDLPHVVVEDAPRFGWRGIHLDVARHFQPLPFLYRFVDQLAALKLNVLHLHLTDDQGWRFDVRGYPELVRQGAWRTGTHAPEWADDDGSPHGGYYTQDQLRALVGYAERHGVTIVPEIDLPGHVRSLLAAYPRYGDPDAERLPVATGFGVFDEVLHLAPETMAMVFDVFEQLLEVFPSLHIHIGGDECPTTQWRRSAAAAALASELGLAGADELQHWFTARLRDWLAARGRRAVGWDEIVEGRDAPGTVVMSWRGTRPGIGALLRGHDVVMAPTAPTYLDYYSSDDPDEPYANAGGRNTWQDVLAFDPGAGVPAEAPGRLLGVQGQLWSEYLPDPQQVEYQAFPRAAAIAEIAWAAAPASEPDFFARLVQQGRRWDAAGVNHRSVGGAQPWQRGGTGRWRRPAAHGGRPDRDPGASPG